MSVLVDKGDALVDGARNVVRRSGAQMAIAELGWRELLPALEDDPGSRSAVFALFEAQGRELSASGALGLLMAHPYAQRLGDGRELTFAVPLEPRGLGPSAAVISPPPGSQVIVDLPGRGARVVEPDAFAFRSSVLPDGLEIRLTEVSELDSPASLSEEEAAPLRARSTRLGRLAIAFEIVGAAEAALELALGHAKDRHQFGRPIGEFQAVRHMLASASLDHTALSRLAAKAAEEYPQVSDTQLCVLKALAGRNGRRVCEHSLQVLGGIGFLTELAHHKAHSRVLALDSLLGTSNSLTRQLGAAIRTGEMTLPDSASLLLGT